MPTVVVSATLDPSEAERWARPRDDLLVRERLDGDARVGVEGPWRRWERRVELGVAPDGRAAYREVTEFVSAIPVFGPLFNPLIRRRLRAGPIPEGVVPWWSPPERMDVRAVAALASACLIGLCGGFLSTIVSRVLTFAADDLGGVGSGQQSVALTVIRGGVVLTLGILAIADRRGRKRAAIASLTVAGLACVLTAFSPSLAAFTGAQLLTRNLAGAAVLLASIVVAEEVPDRTRAYCVGLQSMCYALGAGIVLVLLPLADLGPWGWRLTCAGAVLLLPFVLGVARHLPESQRFERSHHDAAEDHEVFSSKRLVVLVGLAVAINVFAAPVSQLQADYLRSEHDYSALWVTLFIIATNTPAGIGVILGGRWGDAWGRRPVAAIGMIGYATSALLFVFSGAPMWAASLFSAIVGGLSVATVGVYGPEMFPTARRGAANGVISVAALLAGMLGLLVAGQMAETWSYGAAMSLLALGPVVAAAIIWLLLPETAGRSLEELNRPTAPAADRPVTPPSGANP